MKTFGKDRKIATLKKEPISLIRKRKGERIS